MYYLHVYIYLYIQCIYSSFHNYTCRVDSVIKSWDIGMQNADEYKLLPFPKATIRSVSKGENVSSVHIHVHVHVFYDDVYDQMI